MPSWQVEAFFLASCETCHKLNEGCFCFDERNDLKKERTIMCLQMKGRAIRNYSQSHEGTYDPPILVFI